MPVDPARLSAYFTSKLPAPLTVTGVSRSDVGMSRETWFVRGRDDAAGTETTHVLRMDSRLGAACFTPLRFEFEMYRRLHGTGLPVPAAPWYEDDPEQLIDGREFYVREFADGEVALAGLADPDPAYDALRVSVSKEQARQLARLHTLDWKGLGFAELMAAPEPRDAAAWAIEVLRERMAAFRYEPLPLFSYALAWLREHQPPAPDAVALLKGSNGIGQEVWRDGRIVAMCDWELASIGDPALDWARNTGCVPALAQWGERQVLDYYEARSGIHVPAESVRYYRAFYYAEMVAVCHRAGLPAVRGQVLTPALAWLSTVGLASASRALVAALRAAGAAAR